MRLHLTRSLILLAVGIGVVSLFGVPAGTAEDVDHNAEIRSRLAQWKARPDADRLFKGVRYEGTSVVTQTQTQTQTQIQTPTGGRAVALCIGVDRYMNDAAHYGGIATALKGCVNDAKEMAAILRDQKFEPIKEMHNEQATADAVIQFIKTQSNTLQSGDIFVISFAGHGSQVPDRNGDEADQRDETLCMNDRMLIDDELHELWKGFKPGVRIVFLADSCHSGTVFRLMEQAEAVLADPPRAIAERTPPAKRNAQLRQIRGARGMRGALDIPREAAPEEILMRSIPFADVEKKNLINQSQYDHARSLRGEEGRGAEIQASLLTFAACLDTETAGEVNGHGVFTAALMEIWNKGAFSGNYGSFADQIEKRVRGQKTKFSKDGVPNPTFEGQKPFTK